MEYITEIKIRKEDLPKLELEEIKFWWGEELLSDSPRRFRLGKDITVYDSTKDELNQDMNLISLNMFEEIYRHVNQNADELKELDSIKFLENVYSLDYFEIIMRDIDENVNEVIEFKRDSDMTICDIMLRNLKWENLKNIRIYRNEF